MGHIVSFGSYHKDGHNDEFSSLCSSVSLENVLLDVKELQRGMDLTRREYSMHGHNTLLKDFIQQNENKLKKLQDDAKIAQVLVTEHKT